MADTKEHNETPWHRVVVLLTRLAGVTAFLTSATTVGWPAAVIGISLIFVIAFMLLWILRCPERTKRLVHVITAFRSKGGLPSGVLPGLKSAQSASHPRRASAASRFQDCNSGRNAQCRDRASSSYLPRYTDAKGAVCEPAVYLGREKIAGQFGIQTAPGPDQARGWA